MPFVLDASMAAAWAFDDEDQPIVSRTLQRMLSDSAFTPALWWFEVRNALLINERRERTTRALTREFLCSLQKLSIRIDDLPNEFAVLELASERNLTFYDASYLELAMRRHLPLATLDEALRTAALAEGVPLAE